MNAIEQRPVEVEEAGYEVGDIVRYQSDKRGIWTIRILEFCRDTPTSELNGLIKLEVIDGGTGVRPGSVWHGGARKLLPYQGRHAAQ